VLAERARDRLLDLRQRRERHRVVAAVECGECVRQYDVNQRINMPALPRSSAGLNAGDLWNNNGVLNIV